MIPRFQRVAFWAMLVVAVIMAIVLIRMRERAHDRLITAANSLPLSAPSSAPVEKITLLVANDLDGSLIPVERSFPMPKDPNARARVLMQKLLEEYAAPKSTHPIANASGVDEVFLMPVSQQKDGQGLMAVVNLNSAFVQAQPSGIEPETLTVLSMIATLHADLPQITEVRFLVDGQQKDTLAGHADLTRVYLASDTETAVRE
ncbi:GerMN domain-containing protein [Acidobacterium sp. S8]|uniref:GerMN domain-containing protein n=1 Tax=Acidobacterium sp. S8 TaxID=1641854 RepID=UPI00131CB94B|nr:GerMN domain-containing protein [Acidobacterium sp. S8]